MAARLSKTWETSFAFKPCSVAMSFTMAPFVNALLVLAAFMVFIAFMGAMLPRERVNGQMQAKN